MLITILRGIWGGRIDVLETYTTEFRAFPLWDAETSLLNAARYFSFCELTINEVNVRNGFSRLFLREAVIGYTCNVAANYVRPVKVWKKFQSSTQLVGWDEKFIYRRNRIYQDGELKFEAIYKILIASWKKKSITPKDLLRMMGYEGLASPPLPPEVQHLNYRAK
jgi:acyl-CoA thioesterase FadM